MDRDHSSDGTDKMVAPRVVEAASLPDASAWTKIPPSLVPPDLAGRRISLIAWALAALAGIAIWVVFFKLI